MTSALRGALILDLQALQSIYHRDRGIGRWARDFTRTLCETHRDAIGAILLNPDLPVPDNLGQLAATGKVGRPGDIDLSGRIYHVLSPFEPGVSLERLWPRWVTERGLATVVTLFDLIPQVYPGRYLADAGARRRYRTRLELIRAADAVLAISEATRADGVSLLGLDPSRITSVGTGISPAFHPPASRAQALVAARGAVPGLEASFILSVGGEDDRKNIEGLMAGYALLPPELRARHQLVVACHVTDGYRSRLQTIAGRLGIGQRLLLTGFVNDATLVAMYQTTGLFAFASLYEGFGLPVAEAMACGAPAVASNVSALAEVADPAGQFDPADPTSIANAMQRGLSDPQTRAALQAASNRPAPTWSGVVDRAVAVYEELAARDRSRPHRVGAQP